MQLSKNFSLAELTTTNSGLPNVPDADSIKNLTELCIKVLQPLRELYGNSIHITSGYRSFEVNKAANHGAVKPSQHMKGQAADLNNGRAENIKMYNLIKDHFPFDQLINESDFTWIHVSYNANQNRKMLLKL